MEPALPGGELAFCAPCRAPADQRAYDQGEDEGPCFLCRYRSEQCEDEWERGEREDAVKVLKDLIDTTFSDCDPAEFTRRVQAFYDQAVRSLDDGLPPWSRRCIWAHVTSHAPTHERLLADMTRCFAAQVQSLREVAWSEREDGAGPEPDHRAMQLMDRLARTTMDLAKATRSVRNA